MNQAQEYTYRHGELGHIHEYLLPALDRALKVASPRRVFEIGCGNGAVAGWMHGRGLEVVAIDVSASGIQQARTHHPRILFEQASAYDDLAARFGTFPMVISLEVVEHLYDPRRFVRGVFDLLEPGGLALISTPYHGYWKNLALALTGKMDAHFTALWDGGHIKFWSERTLASLLQEAGFENFQFRRVGRVPALAKSMIATARKPHAPAPLLEHR